MMPAAFTLLAQLLIISSAALENPVSFDPPPALRASLIEARKTLELTGECAETLSLEAEYERREQRFWSARNEAAGLWGSEIDLADHNTADAPKVRCDVHYVHTALASTDAALDLEAKLFRQASSGIERGLWLGPLKLCRATVKEAQPGVDQFIDRVALSIVLTKEATIVFAQITSRSVNHALPIRLSGRIISAPNVNEPILGGVLQISGPDAVTLQRAQLAATTDC